METCKTCLFYNKRTTECFHLEANKEGSCPYHIQLDKTARVCANCKNFFQQGMQGMCVAPEGGILSAHALCAACWQFEVSNAGFTSVV